MKPFIILIAAALACAGIIQGGAALAEYMISALPAASQANGAVVEFLFTTFIFGPILLAGLIGAAATGINPVRLGRRPGMYLGLGALIGGLGLAGAAGYASLSGGLAVGSGPDSSVTLLLLGSALVLLQAASEEIYFRGWLQPFLAGNWGTVPAVLVTAIIFAAMHAMGGARTPFSLLNLLLGGLLFGLLAVQGRGIAAPLAAHLAWNWTEMIGLGLFPNPGTSGFGAMVDLDLVGSAFWGGGEEGLNASVPMTVSLLALLIPVAMLAYGGRVRVSRPAGT
jgi:membrane protease YdiL (CAAX protease family)